MYTRWREETLNSPRAAAWTLLSFCLNPNPSQSCALRKQGSSRLAGGREQIEGLCNDSVADREWVSRANSSQDSYSHHFLPLLSTTHLYRIPIIRSPASHSGSRLTLIILRNRQIFLLTYLVCYQNNNADYNWLVLFCAAKNKFIFRPRLCSLRLLWACLLSFFFYQVVFVDHCSDTRCTWQRDTDSCGGT